MDVPRYYWIKTLLFRCCPTWLNWRRRILTLAFDDCHGYFSQYGQDKFVDQVLFKEERGGVFLDVGAYDGVTINNTYFLEQSRGWTGMCVEPLPREFAKLRSARRAVCVNGCAALEDGSVEFLQVHDGNEMLSGRVETFDRRHVERIEEAVQQAPDAKEIIRVRAYALPGLLRAHGFSHVDFLSLDTEGGELDLLKSLDLAGLGVRAIAIENNYGGPEIESYLSHAGYDLVAFMGCDEILSPLDEGAPVRRTMACTVIFTHGGGRFGNQLLQFGHLIALTEDHRDLNLVNWSFWPYADLCAGTSGNPLCYYAPGGRPPPALGGALARTVEGVLSRLPASLESSLRFRLPRMAHRHLPSRSVDLEDTWGGVDVTAFGGLRVRQPAAPNPHAAETFDLGNPALIERCARPGSILLAGWPLRNWDAFDRHADKVRAFLAPAGRFQDIARPFILELRRKYTTLVGVLIRQQDYRVWDSGRYFFSSPQYRDWMAQAATAFGPDCCLVVATDEHQPPDILHGLNAVWCTGALGQTGHFVESMTELSLCDVIVSPPSTFAGWAAFMGQVPQLPLTRADQVIRREDLTDDPFHTVEPRPARAPL